MIRPISITVRFDTTGVQNQAQMLNGLKEFELNLRIGLGLQPERKQVRPAEYSESVYNCGGACIKAGHANWALTLKKLPEVYADWERQENEMRAELGNVSILNDRRGDGKKKPMSLTAFRERIESGNEYDQFDFGGCGCAID